ncbi:hypothetical protein [Segnochrobactrum spirostomi]|uniref:Glycosyltransferase RgtA/B/C/D-like domain-containing protein n=1 Tax=Segnochrobactrum spirostomi TaxID=2608987 RepID=A0A6A7XYB2_9HYPH|nr:hypothetical protein [Segnochrobactrum spirostomi]MQT11690.1 hypothetical protein [Segnochrobactrum spirostomi]
MIEDRRQFSGLPVAAVIATLVIAAHLALVWLPGINLEWAFSGAARSFATGDADLLARYFAVEANSLGLPMLAYGLHAALPFIGIDLAPRLFSIAGLAFLAAALVRLRGRLGLAVPDALLVALVVVNPLVWTFSGRGTADFLPAALAIFAVALAWERPGSGATRAAAVVAFALAIILKYHAALLLPLIWLEGLSRPGAPPARRLSSVALITAAILVWPLLFLAGIRAAYGFWIAPPQFQSIHGLVITPGFVATNLVAYAGYLALLLMPLPLLALWRRRHSPAAWVIVVVGGAGLFVAGALLLAPNGEMNFGPLDRYLAGAVVGGAFAVCAGFFVVTAAEGVATARSGEGDLRLVVCLILGIVAVIGALALTRPAQRYLLFLLPLAYLFVAPLLARRKILAGLVIAVSLALDLFVAANQLATGRAAAAMVTLLSESGGLAETDPGALAPQVGDRFPLHPAVPPAYTVVEGRAAGALAVVESAPVPFAHKVYSLVRSPAP